MQAGRLEIEIVAEIAKLQEDMRRIENAVGKSTNTISRQAKAANDNLRNIGRGAGAGVQQFSRDVQQLKAQLDPAWAAAQRFRQQQELVNKAFREGAITAKQQVAALRANAAAFQAAGGQMVRTSGAMQSGFQQAGFQISDFAVQVGGGTSAIRAASQQAPQFIQALSLMGMGADKTKGKFSAFLGLLSGPWGIALTVAASVAGALAVKLMEVEDATKDAEFATSSFGDAQSILGGVIDLTTGKINTQSAALLALAQAQAMAGQLQARREQAEARSEMVGIRKGSLELQGGMMGGLRVTRVGDATADVVSAFQDGSMSLKETERSLRSLLETGLVTEEQYLKAAQAVVKFGVAGENIKVFEDAQRALNGDTAALQQFLDLKETKPKTDRRAETLLREARATEALIKGLGALAQAYLESDAAAMKAEITAKATEQGIKKRADLEQYVARQMRLAVAERTADAAKLIADLSIETNARARLNEQIAAGALTIEKADIAARDEAELRPFLTALAVAEGDAKQRLAEIIERLRNEQEKANKTALRSQELKILDQQKRQLEQLRAETELTRKLGIERIAALKGKRGDALEDDLARINLEHEKATILLRGQAEAAHLLKQGLDEAAAAVLQQARAETELVDLEGKFEREATAARRLADELDRLISALAGIGGVGSIIGGLLGFATGDFNAVGGPLGALLNSTVSRTGADGTEVARKIGDELRDIFKLDGEFGKTMTSILGGAGTGLMAANAFGMTGTTSQIGSAIGGAIGSELSDNVSKAIGGALGSVAGAALPIIGGLLGGALGGLLSSTPRGSVNIGDIGGELGITGSRGNSSGRIAASTKTANAIIDSLESLAAQLGATIDPSRGSVSIGIRKGNYRVDTSGQGKTKTKKGAIDFGQDAEAAAYFAMLDLIKDGVLQGLRAGTERLLKNADNLEAGLAKALQFENVFKELKERTDPLGFAMEEIGREAAQLTALFKEAGATAEEYAQLEELLALKREEAIDRARQDALDSLRDKRELEIRILELLGHKEDALAAARELELEGLKDTLKPLQSMIYQLEDARLIMDQFEPLAADLRAFKQELLGSNTRNSFATLAARFNDTAALAKNGDADALAQLRGVSSEFLESARANASSRLEYDRAVGQVLAAVDDGIFAAESQIEYAQLQIDAIEAQTDILASIRDKLDAQQQVIAAGVESINTQIRRWEGNGIPVRPDDDNPIYFRLPDGYIMPVVTS